MTTGVPTPTAETATAIVPDLAFKRRILGAGAHDLSACYQCGTCTAVCPIAPPDNPFPRKEMIWVQWGMKERVLSNASLWLCHQCGACSAWCPRDAKPADLMAALRDYSIGYYAVPRWVGRALSAPRCLPLLLLLPIAIFAGILAHLGHLTALPAGTIVYAKFFPIRYIEVTFLASLALSLSGAALGGVRYWRALSRYDAGGARPRARLWPTLAAIVAHRKFRQCAPGGTRRTYKEHLAAAHRLVLWGFLGLVATTTSVGIGIYAFGYKTPWPLWHPVKILGNVSGAALIAGLAVLFYRRAVDAGRSGRNAWPDWLFLGVLVLTALTGFATEGLRLAGIRALAYPTYFVHLVLIYFLLVYFPYSKFAHVIYRPLAMLHSPGFVPEAAPVASDPIAAGR